MSDKVQTTEANKTRQPAAKQAAPPAKNESQPVPAAYLESEEILRQTRIEPQALRPQGLLRLQRLVGNQAVNQLLATRIVSTPAPVVQRTSSAEEEELQTKRATAADSFDASDDFESRLNAARGGGAPLPDTVRESMEPRFGADFSGVRLHTGSEAAQLNREVSAQAFTQGQDIYLGESQTDLESSAGQRLLAHELTHVAQQSSGALQRGSTPAPGIIQRLVKITFEEPDDEMEDFDTATAKITDVLAERDQNRVAVENKFPASLQKAHTTSHVVFTNMFVRDLDQKTWAQAWKMLKDKYQFLHNLLTKWYADDTLKAKANAQVKNTLPGLIQKQIEDCDAVLQRGGHPITGPLWGAKPTAGDATTWKYYNHKPDATDGVDLTTHVIKPWKPLLSSSKVHQLEEACEQWMELRGQIPWTSVDAESYVTGDKVGPKEVETAAENHAAKVNLSASEAKEISDAIIKTFDFFPASLTQARKYELAAAVAARHVVEHFQYHASIQLAWRDAIAAQFLVSWEEKIESEKNTEDKQTARANEAQKKAKDKAKTKKGESLSKRRRTNRQISPGRETTALESLQTNWNEVKNEYNRVYALLKTALV